jgi:1,4-alpha-glucan branching enzyme
MGNEFGHPEWIDFPREGNNWSYRFARRQWHLVDNPALQYHFLARFDQEMIALANAFQLLESPRIKLIYEHNDDKVMAIERAGLLFVFNFHPLRSFSDYQISFMPGKYQMIFSSDLLEFGGHERLKQGQLHFSKLHTTNYEKSYFISLYLPSRTALVLQSIDD